MEVEVLIKIRIWLSLSLLFNEPEDHKLKFVLLRLLYVRLKSMDDTLKVSVQCRNAFVVFLW